MTFSYSFLCVILSEDPFLEDISVRVKSHTDCLETGLTEALSLFWLATSTRGDPFEVILRAKATYKEGNLKDFMEKNKAKI